MKNLLFITTLFFYFTGRLFGQTEGIQLYAKLIDNSKGFTKCTEEKSTGTFIFKIISSTDPKMIPGNTIAIAVICPVNLQRGLNVDQGYHLGLFNTPNCNGTLVENLLEDGGSFIRKYNKSEQLYWTNALDELNPDFIRMVEVKQGIADFTASELNKEEPLSGEYYVTSDTEPKEKNELVTNDNFSFETRSESYLRTDSIGIYVDTTKMDYYDYRFKGYQMYVYNVSNSISNNR